MKKFILALALALLASVGAQAQQPQARFVYTNSAIGASPGVLEIGSGVQFHQLTWNVSGSVPTCQVQLDQSADNLTWSSQIIAAQTCTSNGLSAVSTATTANYVRINIVTKSGAGTVTVTYLGYTSNPGGGGGSIVSCTAPAANGAILFQNGTSNTATCDPNLTWTPNGGIGISALTTTNDPNNDEWALQAISMGTITTNTPVIAALGFSDATLNSPNTSNADVYGVSGQTNVHGSGTYSGVVSGIVGTASFDGAGTVAELAGNALEQNTNSGGGVVTLNVGFDCGDQHGVSGVRNACYYAPNQGTGANDYAAYYAGGKIHNSDYAASLPLCTDSGSNLTTTGCGAVTPASTPGIPSYNGPNIIYASNYGVVAKGFRVFDASWTNSTKTVTVGNNATDTDPCITAGMIGYLIAGIDGASTTPSTTSTNRFGYPATITGVNSCTSFTVTNTPTASCTSSAGNSLCQLVIAPNDDYTALNTAFVAMMGTVSQCNGKLVLPQGLMWISQPPRGSFTCNADTSSNGTATGYYIEGQGANSSIIFPAPSGLWTGGGANNGALFYNTGTAAAKGIHLANFAVDGAGQYAATGGTGYMFSLGQNSSASYVNVLGTGMQGILCGGGDAAEAIVDHVNSGGNPLGISVGNYCKSSHSAYFWGTGATTGEATFNGNPAWSTNDTFDFNKNTNGANVVLTAGETWMTGAAVLSNSTNNPLINVTNGAILHLSHSKVYNCINGTNGVGLTTDATPSIVYLQDTRIACTATNAKALSNAGTIYDLGGNILQSTIANTLTGTYNMNPQVVGADVQLAKAAAQTAKTLFTVGATTTFFRVHLSVECTTTSASATVTPAVLYTDTSNTAQTVTGTAATCTALGAASNTSQDVTFRAKNATTIQYQTTIANTPTYDISVNVEQLGIN